MNRLKTLEGRLLFLILLLSTFLIFTRLALISFVVLLLIEGWLTSNQKRDWLGQTVWFYVYFFCFFTLFISFWSLIGFKLNPVEPLLGLAALVWYTAIRSSRTNREYPAINWAGVAAGLAVSVYVCLPIILHPSSATVLRYSSKTIDDTSHIARIEAIRSFGSLLYQRQSETSKLIDPGTAVSPQGWHANGAFLESLMIKLKGSDTLSTRLLSYLLYKTLWLFITVCLLHSLFRAIRQRFTKHAAVWFDGLSALGVSAISIFLLVAVYGYGFQNFVASIGLLCVCLTVALRLTRTDKRAVRAGLLSLVVLTAATFYVWTLSGVIAGLISLAVFSDIAFKRYKTVLSARQYLALVILGGLSFLPIYELIKSGSERGIKTINIGGATPPIRTLGVVALFLLTLIGLYLLRPKRFVWLAGLLTLASSGFLLLSAYQWVVFGESRYYATKLAFISSAVLSVTLLAIVEKVVNSNGAPKRTVALGYLLTIVFIPLILGLDLRKSAYPLKNSAPITDATARKILHLSDSPNNKNVIIYTSNKGETFLANKLWSSVQLYNNQSRKTLLEKLQPVN